MLLEIENLQEPAQQGPEEQLCDYEIDSDLLRALKSLPEPFLTPLILREIYESFRGHQRTHPAD